MTVTYTHEVATGKGFGNFWRLLARWKGSIYKVVIPELFVYAILFAAISLMYHLWLKTKPDYKSQFEDWVKYCSDYGGMIPIAFVLGFYVSIVVSRWWAQFTAIPWPDTVCGLLANSFHGRDEESRLMRRTIARYLNLAFVRVMVMVSPQAKKRFPTNDHLVQLGLLYENEKEVFDGIAEKTDLVTYWIPIVWAGNIIRKARDQGKITEPVFVELLLQVQRFRTGCGELLSYDWINIPLVYTQVVTLAVYLYFAAGLFGRQFIDSDDRHKDLELYVPIFLFLEFFFYTGWLKVAETMVNPFGEDDDDFEVNWIIDRNITIAFMILDEINETIPPMVQDKWWNEVYPTELPYTLAAQKFLNDSGGIIGTAQFTNLPTESQSLLLPSELGAATRFPGSILSGFKSLIHRPRRRLRGSGSRVDRNRRNEEERQKKIDESLKSQFPDDDDSDDEETKGVPSVVINVQQSSSKDEGKKWKGN